MNIPFQIYDFVSILFPGIFVLFLIKVEMPGLELWTIQGQYGNLTVLFVCAYIVGHFIQGFARTKRIKKAMNWLNEKFSNIGKISLNNQNRQVMQGRHYNIDISPKLKEQIDIAFEGFYGVNPNDLKSSEIFDMIYTPVADKMGQRGIFVAIANFLRAMGLICFLYCFYMIGKSIYIIHNHTMKLMIPETIAVVLVAFISSLIFIKDADYFKRLTDSIPYLTFLSWYKQLKK